MQNRRDEKGRYLFNGRNDTENILTKEIGEIPRYFGIMYLWFINFSIEIFVKRIK